MNKILANACLNPLGLLKPYPSDAVICLDLYKICFKSMALSL